MIEVKIEGPNTELEDLRKFLIDELGNDIELNEISSIKPGQLGEPILISLIVALGGPTIIYGFVSAYSRWLEHRETMKKLDIEHREKMARIKLKLLYEDRSEATTLDDLLNYARGIK